MGLSSEHPEVGSGVTKYRDQWLVLPCLTSLKTRHTRQPADPTVKKKREVMGRRIYSIARDEGHARSGADATA